MVRPPMSAERAAELRGKLETIKEYADALLLEPFPRYNQYALYRAIREGGWRVETCHEKNNIRRYLTSVRESPAETEERKSTAARLLEQLHKETFANTQRRFLQTTILKKPLAVRVGMMGGYNNMLTKFVGRRCNKKSNAAKKKKALTAAVASMNEQNQTQDGDGSMTSRGSFALSADDNAMSFSDNGNGEGKPVDTLGQQLGDIRREEEGLHIHGQSRRTSSGINIDPVILQHTSAGASPPQTSSKQFILAPPRQILGELPPNNQLARHPRSALPKHGGKSIDTVASKQSGTFSAEQEQRNGTSERLWTDENMPHDAPGCDEDGPSGALWNYDHPGNESEGGVTGMFERRADQGAYTDVAPQYDNTVTCQSNLSNPRPAFLLPTRSDGPNTSRHFRAGRLGENVAALEIGGPDEWRNAPPSSSLTNCFPTSAPTAARASSAHQMWRLGNGEKELEERAGESESGPKQSAGREGLAAGNGLERY